MFALNTIKVTAKRIVSAMDRCDSISFIQDLLNFFHHVLGLNLIIFLMEDNVTHQDFAECKSLFVCLDLFLKLLEECQSLFSAGYLLDNDSTDFRQRKKVDPAFQLS